MNGQMNLDDLFPDDPETAKKLKEIVKREQGPPPEVPPPAQTIAVYYGTYTIVRPGKKHQTIEVTPWKNRPGHRVFSMLVGPDNGLDFQGFGSQGPDATFKVWRSFVGRKTWIEAAQALIALCSEDPGSLTSANELYALKSSRCARCHRKLTVPASVHAGHGPECAEKKGVPYGE